MEQPQVQLTVNNGQTTILLAGTWFSKSTQEIAEDFQRRLKAKDFRAEAINRTLLDVAMKLENKG